MTWAPTRALHRGVGIAALALLAAAALGRLEPVLLAVPFALGTALSLVARPDRPPRGTLTLDRTVTVEGGPVAARVMVTNPTREPVLCALSTRVPAWIRLAHGVGRYAALGRARTTTTVRLQGTAHRWGRYLLGPSTLHIVACDGLLVARGEVLAAVPLTVYPAGARLDSREPLARAAGIVGVHRSRQPGDGVEFAEARPFQAGDRLRRINWRVTQRTGALHVNATSSDRDADVLLLLDVRHEAGVSGGIHGASTVLDTTVRAAAVIAEHYARQGDRVGMVQLGSGLSRLPAGTGRRHYLSALEWLAAVNPAPSGFGLSARVLVRTLQPATALLIVLTPLLDQEGALLLATLVRAGRSPVAVDALPDRVHPPVASSWSAAAVRLWQLERGNTIGRLRGFGVPIEPWHGPSTLDLLLRQRYRLTAGRRAPAR